MGFWGSLFGGSNPTLNKDIAKTGAIADWSTGLGEKNLNASSKFFSDILSGDATKQMAALSPEVTAAKTSTASDNKTSTLFGTRSGGTAAGNAARTDNLHSYLTSLFGDLTGSAASNLVSMGSNMLGTGIGAYGSEAELSQKRMENWSNSILGKGVTSAVAAGESMALGAAGGAMAGIGAGAGANAAYLASLG